MPEKYVRREGLPILVRHTGLTTLPQDPPVLDGAAPVICLHDAGLQSSVFLGLLEALSNADAAGGGAIAFDLPGHGRSGSLDALPSITAMTEMAQWVGDWCRADGAILVGHGMGALVALEWARTRPASVKGLVLCGAGLALGVDDTTIETMRQVTRGKAPRPFDPARISPAGGADMMRKAYMEFIQTDPRASLVDLEATRSWSEAWERDCGIPECPVTLVCGSDEAEPNRERTSQLAERLGEQARIETVEAASHFLPLEKPDDLARSISAMREVA